MNCLLPILLTALPMILLGRAVALRRFGLFDGPVGQSETALTRDARAPLSRPESQAVLTAAVNTMKGN